jgi:hypothetical protein
MSDLLNKLDSVSGGKAGAALAVADKATGGAASRSVSAAEQAAVGQARAFAQSVVDTQISGKVEAVATNIAKSAVEKGLAAIPSREELKALGQEIAQQLLDYLRTQVLSKIYFDVAQEVRLNGFSIGDARKAQMYATLVSKIPQAQKFEVLGVALSVNIRGVVQAALPPAAFNKVVDDAVFLLSTIADTVKPEAITIGRRFASSFVLLGVIAGSALTYGLVRLYDSTSDAPFSSRRKS